MRWLVVVLLAGCSAPVGQRSSALSNAHTLWVDLVGASIANAPTDNATQNQSSLGAATVPAFDPSMAAPDVSGDDAKAVLVSRVQQLFLPYNVEVTSTAPPVASDFFAVYVGGTSAILASQPSGIAGVGDVDCNDVDPDSTGFAFSSSFTPDTGGLVSLAATIAHEAGHGLGLEHTTNAHDPMYSVASPQQTVEDLFTLAFGSGTYSTFTLGAGQPVAEACGHADPLDNVALLTAALGANPSSLGAPPTVDLAFPPMHPTLPQTVPVEVNATGATRVEVYRDLRLVAVLNDAPYTTTLTLPIASATTLTIEAVGPDGQRARTSQTFAVQSDVAALCDANNACATGFDCIDNECKLDADAFVSSADASVTQPTKKSGGCDVGHGDPSALALLATGWMMAAMYRRSRRVSPSA